MKRHVVECYLPKGRLWMFATHDCQSKGEAEQAIFDFKLEGAQRIKVFEMTNVTKDFTEIINE